MDFSKALKGPRRAGYDPEPTIVEVKNLCHKCGHLNRQNAVTCTAFPNGIPMRILLGVYDHHNPYDLDGVSDGGLTYVPMDEDLLGS